MTPGEMVKREGSSSYSRECSNESWSLDWKSIRNRPLASVLHRDCRGVGQIIDAGLPGELAHHVVSRRPRAEAELPETAAHVGASHEADLGLESGPMSMCSAAAP